MINRLSPLKVKTAKPNPGRQATTFADGGNLFLQCTTGRDGTIRRSWLFQYELNGHRDCLGLGPLHTIDLHTARAEAKALREMLVKKIDPREARDQERRAKRAEAAKRVTFRQCAEMYLALHRDGWKNSKHQTQWENTLATYAYPVIGDLEVAAVDSAMVLKIVQPIWKTKNETAGRVRGRIEAILDYATANQFRSGDNPAKHIVESLPKRSLIAKVQHHSALPYAEIAAFMAGLRDRESLSARALEFTILTAVRTGETIGATWDEIDLGARTWTISGERMKMGREHKAPLTDRAIAILQGLPRHGEHVFAHINGATLSNMAMLQMLRGMRGGTTVHGFRSTFRDWAAECTSYPNHVVEMALAHTVGGKVEAAYRRGDLFTKRARLMQAWDQFCTSTPVVHADQRKVVKMRG